MRYIIAVAALAGCVAGVDPRAVAYGVELQACANTADSWPAYRSCEHDVKVRYNRLDGGAD